jgi:hypothetical protein
MESSSRAVEESDAAKGNQDATTPTCLMHEPLNMITNEESERANETNTAAARVFAIPELLETVLVRVADEADVTGI